MDSAEQSAYINPSYIAPTYERPPAYTPNGQHKIYTIEMRDGDTLQTQMSIEGEQIMAAQSPRITVTFHNVSKVIDVPAKMIDPSSKERFIQRTLLDNLSGQIHPRQIVALMGPSGEWYTCT